MNAKFEQVEEINAASLVRATEQINRLLGDELAALN